MAFRSDREALKARADAATEEAARLRTETETLRDENRRLKEQVVSHALSRQSAAPTPQLATSASSDPPAFSLCEEPVQATVLRSLRTQCSNAMATGLLVAVAFVPLWSTFGFGIWGWACLWLASIGLGLLIFKGVIAYGIDSHRHELMSRCGLDEANFANLAGAQRSTRWLRVVVHMNDGTIHDSTRDLWKEFIGRSLPEGSYCTWRGEQLEIVNSRRISSYRPRWGSIQILADNGPAIAWFRQVMLRCVLPVVKQESMKQVEVLDMDAHLELARPSESDNTMPLASEPTTETR